MPGLWYCVMDKIVTGQHDRVTDFLSQGAGERQRIWCMPRVHPGNDDLPSVRHPFRALTMTYAGQGYWAAWLRSGYVQFAQFAGCPPDDFNRCAASGVGFPRMKTCRVPHE